MTSKVFMRKIKTCVSHVKLGANRFTRFTS